jgi:hypothetical protein
MTATTAFFHAAMATPATFVALATGTIVLAIRAISELWCRPLEHGPKVLTEDRRFALAAGKRFRAQNRSRETVVDGGVSLERWPAPAGGIIRS